MTVKMKTSLSDDGRSLSKRDELSQSVRSRLPFLLVGLFCVAGLMGPVAQATLGGSPDSIKSDRESNAKTQARKFSAVKTDKQGAFEFKEYSHASHRVRQYYSGDKVFAVTCSGRTQCDHKQLLGAYSDEFDAELQKSRALHRGLRAPIQISSEHLTGSIVSNGRIFISKIVLKDAAPADFVLEEMP